MLGMSRQNLISVNDQSTVFGNLHPKDQIQVVYPSPRQWTKVIPVVMGSGSSRNEAMASPIVTSVGVLSLKKVIPITGESVSAV